MIVAFGNSGIDAADIDSRANRRILGVLAVDLDLPIEFREFSVSRAEELVY